MPISRVFDPYTGGAIGGGDGPSPIAPVSIGAALDPEQALASSTTTWTVEWPAATGGDGSYTYTVTVKDQAGNSVVPSSGSDEGPYVIPVVTPNSYIAYMEVEDGAGLTAESSAMARVAASTGTVGWTKVADLDFAGITSVSQTSAGGTGTLAGGDFDGLPYKWDRPSGTVGSVNFTTDGMLVTGATTGSYECSIDISSLVTASSEDDIVVALYVRDIAGITSTTRGLRLAISAAGTLASGINDGMKAQYQSAGIWLPNIMRNDTTTTSYGGTAAIPTEGRLVVRLRGGLMANSAWTAGSTAEPDAADIAALFLHQISFGAKASPTYSTALWVGLSTIYSSVAELYRVIVYVPGVV